MTNEKTVTLSHEAAAMVAEMLRHSGLHSLARLFEAQPAASGGAYVFGGEACVLNDQGQSCMTLLQYMELRSIASSEELMIPDNSLRDGFKMRALARRRDAMCVRVSTPASFAAETGITEVNAYPVWLLKKHFGR